MGISLIPTDDPVAITATGLVNNAVSGNYAIYGPAGTMWTITNAGVAVGRNNGLQLSAAAIVTNSNFIGAVNGTGIVLGAGNGAGGGTVINLSTGTVLGSVYGIINAGAAATITNVGRIGSSNTGKAGILFGTGGIATTINQGSGSTTVFVSSSGPCSEARCRDRCSLAAARARPRCSAVPAPIRSSPMRVAVSSLGDRAIFCSSAEPAPALRRAVRKQHIVRRQWRS